MKKSILLLAFVLGAFSVNAQTDQKALQGTKMSDNWSWELKAGGVTPLTHSAFLKNARPAFGVGISKQLTPIFGLGVQGMGYVNTSNSKTAFDVSDVSLLGKINLMNLLGGYQGAPRVFEMEAMAGMGWLHYYQNGSGDTNSWSTRFGLNLNFNMGETKAWTLGIKPALVYDMQGDFSASKSRFNANNASFELTLGLTYHFFGSNGERYFTQVRPYDPMEIAELNSTINDMRSEISNQNYQLGNATSKIDELKTELDSCHSRVVVQPVVMNNRIPESIITFRQGKSVVDASQLPNVERVALYLNKHQGSSVVIKGYASPEGKLEFNEKLAAARAEAVKSILVNKYRISSSRILAEGQGIGDMFSDPDWNRVSICTIKEAE